MILCRAVILGGEDAQVKREMKVLEHRLKLHEKKERKRYESIKKRVCT